MPRSMWKGVVSFGMVSIPIRLYNATESAAKVSFRQLCPDHKSPISYKRWCAEGEHEVQYGEILKGFEVGKDRYVIINDKDLDNIPLATAHSIDITESVPTSSDPSRYKDEYREAVMRAVQAKTDGEVIEAPAVPQTAKVMDLMEALRASVDAAKKSRAAGEKAAPSEAKRARRKAS